MKNAFAGVIVFLMVGTASLAAEESIGFIRIMTAVAWDGS